MLSDSETIAVIKWVMGIIAAGFAYIGKKAFSHDTRLSVMETESSHIMGELKAWRKESKDNLNEIKAVVESIRNNK